MFYSAQNKLTELCHIMAKHGSDKGAYHGIGRHNYTVYYHKLFSDIRDSVDSVFEFGIGSTKSDIPHTMGVSGKPGASLRGWREYFPNANIYSADIDREVLQPEYRIFKFFCDQTNEQSIESLWNLPELVNKTFDIIIEDGLHVFEAQYLFMKKTLRKVRAGGFYICEDVPDADFDRWKHCLCDMAEEHTDKCFEIIKINNPRNEWNSIILVS